MLEKFVIWQKKRKKEKFARTLVSQLKPKWLLDRTNYVWFIGGINRKISVVSDQIGNVVVMDDSRLVSPYLKTKDEGREFAVNYIANEIIAMYYPKFNAPN